MRLASRDLVCVVFAEAEPMADRALRLLMEVWNELTERVKNRILKLADEALRSAAGTR